MHQVLMIESVARGVLQVNGCFCGPLDGEGQAFPAGQDAEIYIQFFPFSPEIKPLTAALELREGQIARLEPQEQCYALMWPDGVIQLELRPVQEGGTQEDGQPEAQTAASGTLLRYLALRLTGDAQAQQLLMRPQETPELPAYDAVVPLRFAPLAASERFDERAGLVRRVAPNVAAVDAALAVTSPAGQGHRLIERIEVMPLAARP
ncbi:MAG: hypothetical protein Q4F18_07520 [Clostridia bacterium]|nr:hypothetical protein [Clostridia bacterium]